MEHGKQHQFSIVTGPARDGLYASFKDGRVVQFGVTDENLIMFYINAVVKDFTDGSGHDFVFEMELINIDNFSGSGSARNLSPRQIVKNVKYKANTARGEFKA